MVKNEVEDDIYSEPLVSIWVPISIYMYLGREKRRKHTDTSFRGRNFLIMGKSSEFIIIGHLLRNLLKVGPS